MKQVDLNETAIGTCQASVLITYLQVIADVDDDGVGERLDGDSLAPVQHLQALELVLEDEGEEAIVGMGWHPEGEIGLSARRVAVDRH